MSLVLVTRKPNIHNQLELKCLFPAPCTACDMSFCFLMKKKTGSVCYRLIFTQKKIRNSKGMVMVAFNIAIAKAQFMSLQLPTHLLQYYNKRQQNPQFFKDEYDPIDLQYLLSSKSQSIVPLIKKTHHYFLAILLPLSLFHISLWMLMPIWFNLCYY